MPLISAKQLSKRTVREFYGTLLSKPLKTQSLPEDNEKFDGDGIALLINDEVRGLYTYKAFASLQSNATLYYPYGGILGTDLYSAQHRELFQTLLNQLKTNSKVQIIISLEHQSMPAISKVTKEHEFWFALGFSQLDMQVFYQGKVNVAYSQEPPDFSTVPYKGGDRAINTELCNLYREAYKKRQAIPDISEESIEEQLSYPSCSYLILWHNNLLIGQVTLFLSNKECYVDSIFIKRKYWGTVAADVLTQSLFDYAKDHDCDTVSGTAASNNWGSRRLMERFGLVAQHQSTRMILTL